MNFQWFNQAESETGFWFCSEPVNNSVQCPVPSFLSVASNVQSPASRVQHQEHSVQSPASSIQRLESSVQCPESSVQNPESSVQSPESNTCVQSPGTPVCRWKQTIYARFLNEIQIHHTICVQNNRKLSIRSFTQEKRNNFEFGNKNYLFGYL